MIDPASAPIDGCVPGLCPLVYSLRDEPPGGARARRHADDLLPRRAHLPAPEARDRGPPRAGGVSRARAPGSWRTSACSSAAWRPSARPRRPATTTRWWWPGATCATAARRASSPSATSSSPRTTTCARSTTSTSSLNAVHWVAAREPAITLRPKVAVSRKMQFPIPLQNTFTSFQSVGLLLPELLLIARRAGVGRAPGAREPRRAGRPRLDGSSTSWSRARSPRRRRAGPGRARRRPRRDDLAVAAQDHRFSSVFASAVSMCGAERVPLHHLVVHLDRAVGRDRHVHGLRRRRASAAPRAGSPSCRCSRSPRT